jgi:hypothetical protein
VKNAPLERIQKAFASTGLNAFPGRFVEIRGQREMGPGREEAPRVRNPKYSTIRWKREEDLF